MTCSEMRAAHKILSRMEMTAITVPMPQATIAPYAKGSPLNSRAITLVVQRWRIHGADFGVPTFMKMHARY